LHYTTIFLICMSVAKKNFADTPEERSVDNVLDAPGQCRSHDRRL
jgi:hypothetical protein